ncbi:L-histidine N(alpha)-methyltransferase [Candidatus Pacearchaeota archaeon]|nr:L-histidine N(alpha)-methyltransferase [Candidatus Pacearchaeota archaeon]
MSGSSMGQNLWLHDILLQGFLKNGFAKTNGNKSWELSDLQYLSLTDDMARGFLSFATTPSYRKQFFELELRLIKEQADLISKSIGNEPFNLIDIYCGDGFKASELIKEIVSRNKSAEICYCPLNASQYLLDLAVSNVKNSKIANVKDYKPFLSSGDGMSLRNISMLLKLGKYKKNVVVLLGGVIACFDINEYLFELNRDMYKGDVLIMGNGVRVGERLVDIEKYKDKSFHNWFKHVMFAMGFSERDIKFDARFRNSRVEFLYKINKETKKKVEGRWIDFKSGDEFVVAALYKYYSEEFEKFCKMYFTDSKVFTDKDKGYALVVCKK